MAVDQLKVELITAKFGRMLQEFAEIDPTIEFADIVRGVAVRVIAGALRRTRSADAQKIRADWALDGDNEWTTFEGKKYKLSWYLHNDALWERIKGHRVGILQTKLAAVGLSKQSWLHQAKNLGAEIAAPRQVVSANFKGRQHPENVSHVETVSGGAFALRILNASPIVQAAGGREALIFSMAAETRYFYTLLAKGGFKNAESRAKKYPGVYVRPRAAALA